MKTKYSGISSDENLDEFRKALSKQILDHFGIHIKPDDIPKDKNVAIRNIMKLILNSLCGKLCQNFNKPIKFVTDASELYDLVYNKSFENVYFDILDSNTARVICSYSELNTYKVNKTRVALACHVTCYSRLKLWNSLNKLPNNSVLYFDMDSIIYYSDNGKELLQTKSALGHLESELEKNEHIISFVSTGLKSYTYPTNLNKEIIHVKGFSTIKKKDKFK